MSTMTEQDLRDGFIHPCTCLEMGPYAVHQYECLYGRLPMRDLRDAEQKCVVRDEKRPSRFWPRVVALAIVEQILGWLLFFGAATFSHDRHDHIQPQWLKWVAVSLSLGMIVIPVAGWILLIVVMEVYKLWTGDYPERMR